MMVPIKRGVALLMVNCELLQVGTQRIPNSFCKFAYAARVVHRMYKYVSLFEISLPIPIAIFPCDKFGAFSIKYKSQK